MNNGNRKEDKAVVTFNSEVEIGGTKMPAAEYEIEGSSKKIFLITKKGVSIPSKNEPYLIFLPLFYSKGKSIYSVKIIMPKTIGKIKVFKNIFIPDALFSSMNSNEITVIIMNPKEEFPTLLLRIATNNGNKKAVRRFLAKNILLEYTEEVRIKENGIIEIIIKPLEDFDYLGNGFLKRLSEA